MADGGYSLRKLGTIIDMGHILIGISVVLLAVFAFMNPSKYMFLFPVIFLLAGLLDIITGIYAVRIYTRVTGKQIKGVLYILGGTLLIVLFIISAISIWGNF